MKNIKLLRPKLEDLWFRELMLSDKETMSYNAGYDTFPGYHYETGCIDFPKEKWQKWYDEKMSKMFYFFITDTSTNKFVGEVSCRVNGDIGSIGIIIYSKYRGQGYAKPALNELIKIAKKSGLNTLIDEGVPTSRGSALKSFEDVGFKTTRTYETIKFGKPDETIDIELKL